MRQILLGTALLRLLLPPPLLAKFVAAASGKIKSRPKQVYAIFKQCERYINF